jgi:diadenosine tetraphosphatase ApaH/serine/threonine PP2A family protein phosphatase
MVTNFTSCTRPSRPQRWLLFDKLAAAASFTYQNTAVCFFGHTHVPVAFMRDSVVRGGTYSKFKVEQGKKYFVNVGAVGQPRDNNPKAAYVVYDVHEATIELRRLEYDIATAQKKSRRRPAEHSRNGWLRKVGVKRETKPVAIDLLALVLRLFFEILILKPSSWAT